MIQSVSTKGVSSTRLRRAKESMFRRYLQWGSTRVWSGHSRRPSCYLTHIELNVWLGHLEAVMSFSGPAQAERVENVTSSFVEVPEVVWFISVG